MNKKSGFENNKDYGRVIYLVKEWAHNKPYQVLVEEQELGQVKPDRSIIITSTKANTCYIQIIFFLDPTDPDRNTEEYSFTIVFYGRDGSTVYSTSTNNYDVEEALLIANIIRQNIGEDTFLQMLPLLLDAIAQGNIKQYFWRPQWFGWNPRGLCSLTRFRIKNNYFYLKNGVFYQPYNPKYIRRKPIRIVSYEPWGNGNILPDTKFHSDEYIANFVEYFSSLSIICGLNICFLLLIFHFKASFGGCINVAKLYLLCNIIAFMGLVTTAILFNTKCQRYILLFFLPLSVIGLSAVPFGTWIYGNALLVFWHYKYMFFPFDIIYSWKKKKDEK